MFCLISGDIGKEKIYSKGDEITFTLKNGSKLKGTFDRVSSTGLIYIKNLRAKVSRRYENVDGLFAFGVYEMVNNERGYKGKNFFIIDR